MGKSVKIFVAALNRAAETKGGAMFTFEAGVRVALMQHCICGRASQELVRVASEARIGVPNFNDFVEVRVHWSSIYCETVHAGVEPAKLHSQEGQSPVPASNVRVLSANSCNAPVVLHNRCHNCCGQRLALKFYLPVCVVGATSCPL